MMCQNHSDFPWILFQWVPIQYIRMMGPIESFQDDVSKSRVPNSFETKTFFGVSSNLIAILCRSI